MSAASAAAAQTTAITRLHVSRSYVVTKGHRARSIVATFRLRHRADVFFTLVQVSPRCRVVASFSVLGHRGTNRIRIRGGAGRRNLVPGTYRLAARTTAGRSVLYTTVVVRNHKPAHAELASALRANTCASFAELATVRLAEAAVGSILGSPIAASSTGALAGSHAGRGGSGTLGVAARAQPQIGAFSPPSLSKNATNPLAIAAFGAAILLLGVAALPRAAIPDPRLTDLVVRHRAELVVAGTAAFAAGIVALAFS